jgi:hypothetical protein
LTVAGMTGGALMTALTGPGRSCQTRKPDQNGRIGRSRRSGGGGRSAIVVVVVGGTVVVVVVGGTVVVVVVVVGGVVVVVVVVGGGIVIVVVVVVGGVVDVVVVGNGSGSGNSWISPPGEVVVVVMTEGLVEMTLGWVDVLPGLAVEELVEWETGDFVGDFGVLLKITIFGTAVVGLAPGVAVVGGTVSGGGVATVVGAAAARDG